MKYFRIFLIFFLLLPSLPSFSQDLSSFHIETGSGLEKEFADLMNDLDLRDDQKLTLGILVLKYTLGFNYKEFEDASKTKQIAMARSTIKELDRDLKDVLDKSQFKIYKKHKKKIKKELLNSA